MINLSIVFKEIAKLELYTMSKKELDRLEIIKRVDLREIKQEDASKQLDISVRQVQRILQQYRLYGSAGLISKKRGSPSNNSISHNIANQAISIIRDKYPDFGPTLACEKLRELHDIKLSVETTRKIMIDNEIWIPRVQKLKRAYQPRNRRDCYGDMIQIDGSLHHWFEDRGSKTSLLVLVDDATSKIMALHMAPSESTHTYMIAIDKYLKQHGKPLSFYSDKHGVFRVNNKTYKKNAMTQLGRALSELNIDLICANSCQAKGRVERANKTLQDRLVKEFRLRDISTIEAANDYLPKFIEDYNKRFAKAPVNQTNSHRPIDKHEDLRNILAFKQERTVSNSLTIQYDRVLYLLEDCNANRLLRRKQIMLHEYPDGSISLYHKNRKIRFTKMYDKDKPIQGEIVTNKRLDHILEFAKNNYAHLTTPKRSGNCPGKRHLGITNVWNEKRKEAS